jgi:hypothetical protein
MLTIVHSRLAGAFAVLAVICAMPVARGMAVGSVQQEQGAVVVSFLPALPAGGRPPPAHTAIAQPSDTATATPSSPEHTLPPPTAAATVPSPAVVVDHSSVALFDDLPDSAIDAAARLTMRFVDRSVGANIDSGLDCLAFESTADAPSHCRRATHVEPAFSVDPTVLAWSRSGGYDRANWRFLGWSGEGCGDWPTLTACFGRLIDAESESIDVAGFQFSYLEVMPGSTIAAGSAGWIDNPSGAAELAAWRARNPSVTFVVWTTSLARSIGSAEAQDLNRQLSEYARVEGLPLLDVADILATDPAGNACFDNRDGVPYRWPDGGGEDHPDDGLDIPAICQHYTTEVEGGHLGSVSAGKIRVAKAIWVLMAQLAGWQP